MTTPLSARSRLSRSSLSTPNRVLNSTLPKSPSTPYDIYNQRHASPLGSTSTSSPRPTSAFLPSSTSQFQMGAYRRNVGFGSPGVGRSPRFSQGGAGTPNEVASPRPSNGGSRLGVRAPRFIRRKTLKQRLVELPSTFLDWFLFSELLDFGDPDIGYPAGLLLHLISLLTLVIHPEGSLHLSFRSKGSQARSKGLFAEQNSGSLALKRLQSQDHAWRWFATMLAYTLLIAALANAYHLFTARKRYHLWMKPTTEKLSSENASLVDLPRAMDEDPQLTISDLLWNVATNISLALVKAIVWLIDQALDQARQVAYIGFIIRFLFPPSLSRRIQSSPSGNESTQMHAIDMWTAPDVQLRIFCLYSPLHALFYTLHLKSNHGLSQFITLFVLMAIASAQVTILVHYFTNLIKDKNVIAGEVLHEYDEKFVKPRAMPVCRDVSTMTDEAELSAAKRQSWVNRRHSSDDEGSTSSSNHRDQTVKRKARATTGRKSQAVGR